jgi:hypothetical protein
MLDKLQMNQHNRGIASYRAYIPGQIDKKERNHDKEQLAFFCCSAGLVLALSARATPSERPFPNKPKILLLRPSYKLQNDTTD